MASAFQESHQVRLQFRQVFGERIQRGANGAMCVVALVHKFGNIEDSDILSWAPDTLSSPGVSPDSSNREAHAKVLKIWRLIRTPGGPQIARRHHGRGVRKARQHRV